MKVHCSSLQYCPGMEDNRGQNKELIVVIPENYNLKIYEILIKLWENNQNWRIYYNAGKVQ